MSDPLQNKVAEYSAFITNTLQPKLQLAVNDREETEAEICEYALLRNKLQMMEAESGGSAGADRPIADRPIMKLSVGLIGTYKEINKIYYEERKSRK